MSNIIEAEITYLDKEIYVEVEYNMFVDDEKVEILNVYLNEECILENLNTDTKDHIETCIFNGVGIESINNELEYSL